MVIAGAMSATLFTACGGSKAEEPAPAQETAEAPAEESAPAQETAEAPAAETPAAEESEGGLTFEDLQDNYAILSDVYNQVEELYMNDQIAQDDEVESLLTEAKGIIDEMGEATEDDFASQDDYVQMNDSMATMIDALGKIVDGMTEADSAEGASDAEAGDVTYVDGFYANSGDSDFMIAFYEGAAGDVAYVNDGTDEVFAEYTVEQAQLDDGTEYLLVNVGATQLGYYEDGDDVYLVDSDGNIYAAAHLTEEEADELAQKASN